MRILVAGLLGLCAPAAFAQSFNPSLLRSEAIQPENVACERGRAAIVHVYVEVQARRKFKLERPSSGVLVADNLVVTLAELVAEARDADKQLFVKHQDGAEAVPAKIVAEDPTSGLALLEIAAVVAETARPVALATNPQYGERAFVLSDHEGENLAGSAGVVHGSLGSIETKDGRTLEPEQVLLTDAAIQARSHGGALLDERGGLIGICNAEHVRAEIQDPTPEQLKAPSFGYIVPASVIARAFADRVPKSPQFSAPSSGSLPLAVALQSVVVVHSVKSPGPIGTMDPYGKQRRKGVGSGVVLSRSGLILTNAHVVSGGGGVSVAVGKRTFSAKILQFDVRRNVALLLAEFPDGLVDGRTVRVARCADRASIAPGDPIYALGVHGEERAFSISRGAVSAIRGARLQTDASLGNHNAGGALVNRKGEVVAVVDGGVIDKIDLAVRRRGDKAKADTGLNFTPLIDDLLKRYGDVVAEHGEDNPTLKSLGSGRDASPVHDLVKRTEGAMLNIYVEITTAAAELDDNPFAQPKATTVTEGLGSGVIIDPSGLALTNWHVVDSATNPDGSTRNDRVVRASLRSGRVFEAQVLSISREEDLALLQLDLNPGEKADFVELGSSENVRIGDSAIAIGNPHGAANTVTVGVVAAKNQRIRVKGRWAKLPHLLETDAAINGGNSGGALLDIQGRLIGINSAGGNALNVTSYAISVDHVRKVLLETLLSPHKLRRSFAGLTLWDTGRGDGGSSKVEIQGVVAPGSEAGLQRGDVLRRVGNVDVSWSGGASLAFLRHGTDPVKVVYDRDGEQRRTTIRTWNSPAWFGYRQTGLLTERLDFREDPDTVRKAIIAFHREFTGDKNGNPRTIPESVLRVEFRNPEQGYNEGFRAGDLLLGVALVIKGRAGDSTTLVRFGSPADLRDAVTAHCAYEGTKLDAWVYRDGRAERITLHAKRLLY